MNHLEEFRCLNCGEPVEDRFWCEDCRYEIPPDERAGR